MRKLILAFALPTFVATFAHANHTNVPRYCEELYQEAGAVPLTGTCYADAALAEPSLGEYQCLSSPEYITEFCAHLAHFDEDTDTETDDGSSDDGASDDGSSDSGLSDGGLSDDGSSDGGASDDGSSDDGSSDDGASDDGSSDDGASDDGTDTGSGADTSGDDEIEYIEGSGGSDSGDESGSTDDNIQIGDYQEGNNQSGGCGDPTLISSSDTLDFVFAQSVEEIKGLGQYGNVTSAISGANIVIAHQHAQETGDTQLLFDQFYSLTQPFLIGDNQIKDAVNLFSDFSSSGIRPSGC